MIGFQNKLFFGKIEYLGIASVPPLWLIFALSYCGFNRFLTRRNVILLWIIPVITIGMALTNDLHAWMWFVTENAPELGRSLNYSLRGWWWYVSFVYAYALLLTGTLILIRTALGYRHDMRRQMWVLLAAVLLPWAANLLHFFNLDLFGADLTPFAFSISGVILAFGVLRFQLFDLAPVARDLLIENMDDGVIVLDRGNRVADMNPAARRWLGVSGTPIGLRAEIVFSRWPELVDRYRSAEQAQVEIRVDTPAEAEPEYFELSIAPLRDRRGAAHRAADHAARCDAPQANRNSAAPVIGHGRAKPRLRRYHRFGGTDFVRQPQVYAAHRLHAGRSFRPESAYFEIRRNTDCGVRAPLASDPIGPGMARRIPQPQEERRVVLGIGGHCADY